MTPALEFADAIQLLNIHRVDAHGVQAGGGGGTGGGVVKTHLSKIPRTEISVGSSQEDFRQFKVKWGQYVRSSNETDDVKLRDQLLQCPDADLAKAVHRALGMRVENITVVDLLKEIETLAVIKQSNHVNILAMMKSRQERDEPVRQFAARLRGLAAVCDLAALCTCGNTVSMVDRWVLMTLINGLHDEDTQQAVLSKVEEMNLADTIVFVEAREVGKHSAKVLNGGLMSSQVHRVQDDGEGACKFCGENGHGKNPNIDIRRTDCPAFNKRCQKCKQKGHFRKMCAKKGPLRGQPPKDTTKPTAGANTITLNTVKMSEKRLGGSVARVSQNIQNLMAQQQKVKKLRHEIWSEEKQTYVKSPLPEEPKIKLRMCLDILPYRKHDPPLDCNVQKSWIDSLGPKMEQKDIVLKASTADTGAQCFLLGSDHLPGLGLGIEHLLPSEINLNCANSTTAGNLGVFFAKVRGEHHKTGEVVESRTMVYVIRGSIVLVSRAVLETLGCIPKTFPSVGEFLEEGNLALTGKAFAVNPNPIGYFSDGTMDERYGSKPMDIRKTEEKNIVDEIKTSPNTSLHKKQSDTIPVRQPRGECDPESELPCSCPRRMFIDPPDKLPMPATVSNRKAMEDWIKDYYKAGAFNICKRQSWPVTAGPPMKIHTREDAPRTYIRKPTKVPLHFREEVKAGLEADVKKGILERVPVGEKDTWCSRMVIQPKKNGRARRTVDLSGLSKVGRHESHHTRSAAEIVKTIPAGKLKSTLDCVDGYHGVELDKEDRHKTTFSTEWGLFRYRRVPQGYLSSGDSYTKHTDAILDACPGKPAEHDYEKLIDDIIQWSDTIAESFFRICSILSHCNHNGMVFSPEKFEFAKETVEFAGFEITAKGIRPPAKYIESIKNFPTPTNISEVRSWFGLVNQVAYSFVKTTHMAPFRHLLSESKPFEWNSNMESAFQQSKQRIAELIIEGVASFDMNLVTCLSPDFSKQGMGWILQQKLCNCQNITPTCCSDGWRLVLCGAHFCNKAEQNYSPIQGEAMAIARGLEDTKYYTMGCTQLFVATDHKPLVSILGDQSLADVQNPRLARIKEKTLWWQFTIIHTPGKLQLAADALSRRKGASIYTVSVHKTVNEEQEVIEDIRSRFHPIFHNPTPPMDMKIASKNTNMAPSLNNTLDASGEMMANANFIMNDNDISVVTWDKLKKVAEEDAAMVKLMEIVMRGFPQSSYELDETIKQFHKFRHDLHVADGVVCYKDRIVVPIQLRQQILEAIHAAHQGVTGMFSRVEDTVFWPNITTDILRTRGACLTCARDAPSQPAVTPVSPPVPSFPFQYVVGDYFSLAGNNYLVLGDRFSGWLSIYSAGAGEFDAKALVNRSREYFTNFNIPEEIATDGGPQMMSDLFQKSLKAWGVRHRLSAAYHAHANCRAEVAVKVGKRMLRDNVGHNGTLDTDKVMRALLQFRNTPMQDCRRSPAQMVFGRAMRDFIPSLQYKYEPAKDWSVTQEYRERTLALKREADAEKWTKRTKDYAVIEVGTPVILQNQTGNNPNKWDKTGVVLENKPHSQVVIRVDGSRRVTTRNRKFVRKLNAVPITPTPVAHKPSHSPAQRTPDNHPATNSDPTPLAGIEADPDQALSPHTPHRLLEDQAPQISRPENYDQPDAISQLPEQQNHQDRNEGVLGTNDAEEHQEEHVQVRAPPEQPVPEVGDPPRPRRNVKPNSKYSPDVYDLSYVGSKPRLRSRRSIRRAGT